ncbi:MAG: capsule assembly Wzi family protein [Sphaerochaetaceae bacterium]|jgi:hypothetical protein|nr:capsule assembly Wzi family protein [Spirochaetales bacterium]
MRNLDLKALIIVTILVVVTITPLFSYSSTYIFPPDSTIYDEMEALYLVAGYGTPTNKRPWSGAEAKLILSRIDEQTLPKNLLYFYCALKEAIYKETRWEFGKSVKFSFFFDIFGEMYTHTNGEEFNNEADWDFGFAKRSPMLRMRYDLSFFDYLYIYSDLQYQRNRFREGDTFENFKIDRDEGIITGSGGGKFLTESTIYNLPFLTNWMAETYDIDFQVPKRALVSVGGKNWNISLARDKLRWGNGHSGNFVFSDHDDYQEYLRFTAFSDKFSYDWVNMFFETNYNVAEGDSADESFKILMAHRLEFRPIKMITFAISENVMYQNDVFSLRHFNPANIYHNLNNRSMFNAIAHLELDIMPFKGFNIYGQFVLDQATAPNEGDSQAAAYGYLAGVEYALPISKGILTSSLEFATTTPAMYRREYVDFISLRRYFGNGLSFISHFDYIGYQYGGDAQVLQLDVNYRLPQRGNFGLQLFFMRHGVIDFFTKNSEVNAERGSTPSGDLIEETFRASLFGEHNFKRLFNTFIDMRTWVHASYIYLRDYLVPSESHTNARQDFQLTFGVSLTL